MSRLVVGLGNPGQEYEATRHNAGFMVADLLAANLHANYWRDEAGAKVALAPLGEDQLVLAKPQTFVNVSGKAVARLVRAYDVPVKDLIVVHDDIDLPEGVVRAKRGGGHGGHNGLRSISEELASGEYMRVRLGVGRPPGRMDPADYVLEPLRADRLEKLESVLPTAAQAVMDILEHGIEWAMSEYNAE